MPSLIDIRRRIRSVKNTQQITRALKLISAAKLRRAQDRVIAARPYARSLKELLGNLAAASASDERLAESALLAHREEKTVQLILMTSDQGRAGAFNANLTRGADRFFADRPIEFELVTVGRKGRDYYRRYGRTILSEHIGVLTRPAYSTAADIARATIERFRKAEIDAVYLMYNEFRSVLSQKVVVNRILPVDLPEKKEETLDYIFEQPPAEMLEHLLPRYVEVSLFQGMLETAAAEHAARMTAMDAATTNAGKVIDRLTLFMNRARQAAITKEIIEVVSGAAAQE